MRIETGTGTAGRRGTRRDDDDEGRGDRGLRRENAELRARLRAMEHEFDAQWRTEMKSVREAVVERDAEWSKRVDRYRRAATRAARIGTRTGRRGRSNARLCAMIARYARVRRRSSVYDETWAR